jgi:hypothetical protein
MTAEFVQFVCKYPSSAPSTATLAFELNHQVTYPCDVEYAKATTNTMSIVTTNPATDFRMIFVERLHRRSILLMIDTGDGH